MWALPESEGEGGSPRWTEHPMEQHMGGISYEASVVLSRRLAVHAKTTP